MLEGMDLDFSPRTAGRASVPTQVEFVRELGLADLALLQADRGIKPTSLKRITDSHHAVARALASGLRPGAVASVTGYSLSRISILQSDPAFNELLEFYKQEVNSAYGDLAQRMSLLALDADSELRRRLEEEPETFEAKDLIRLLEATADRTGHGVKTTNVNVNIDIAARLDRAKQRLAEFPSSDVGYQVLEAQAVESRFSSPKPDDSAKESVA